MRLGILQCDSVLEDLQPEFGDYPGMFQRLLTTGDHQPEFRTYDMPRGVFPERLDDCDAWLFTGSKASVYDPDEWIARARDVVRELHRERRPTIGICFGHQLIADTLGGRTEKSANGWGVGVHTTRLLAQRPWMVPQRETLSLPVSHQDQVVALPPGAECLAGHDFCPIDMFQLGDHILTFQGHPEFPKSYSQATMDKRRDVIGESTWQSGTASLTQTVHPEVAASWIHHFLDNALRARTTGAGASEQRS